MILCVAGGARAGRARGRGGPGPGLLYKI